MPMTIENLDYSNIFHKFIYGFLAAIFISLLAALDSFAFTCAPFGLVFLTGSVILMRMLRHDENTINQTRFKILNLLSVVGVVLFGLVISSPPFLELCKNTVKSIYLYLIAPVLLFIITQAVNILSFILSFFNFEGFNNRLEPFKMEPVESTDFINPNQYVEPGAADETIKTILIIIILAFVVLLIIRIFRALARNRYRVDNGAGVILERTIIDIVRPKRVALSGPSGKIRDMYKKIIQRCIKKGIPISISATSQDISRMSSHYFEEVKDAERIREIYINTRYGDRAASKEEVREFKRIYLRFKKMGL
jgi:hypothetical protein